ncbi:beta-propeller domain-containing protein [Nannocystis bainbridge]|uniref:Beta-propeller domain-containing protein n=1 Tax=Nannocystis bainbridge TaxID=2995303 RepID=A0ABT5E4M6_9BACT|nr:beta-propeller domain-containing protein [Nannocystis bainbridge]MDC0720817.1 beta-propeller domain-containing protein [Nannocystis bainbridge]
MSRPYALALPAFLFLGALATGCSDRESPGGGDLNPRVLYGFDSCDDLLGYTKGEAKGLIEKYGNLQGYDYSSGWFGDPVGDGGGLSTGGTDSGGESSGGDGGEAPQDGGDNGGVEGDDYSGTNVQEAGVDEPDIVKTDGERILAFAGGRLHFVDASGASPTLRSSLEIGADVRDAQLFMHEDRALLLVRSSPYYYGDWEGAPQPAGVDLQQYFGPDYYAGITRLIEVDIANPDAMKIVSNLHITGDLVSARMVEGVARVVVRSAPNGLKFKDPYEFFDYSAFEQGGGTEALYEHMWKIALAQSKVHNSSVIDASTIENWLPRYVREDMSNGQAAVTSGVLLACDDVMHTGEYSGLSTLGVLTVDLDGHLAPTGGVGVFSEGETVYASKQNLYVATTPWNPADWDPEASAEEQGRTTYVHKFDIQDRSRANYVASGSVRGWLLSQWAMSEHEGDLRVASTDSLGWDQATSESFVSVLRQEGDELQQIGQVGGLGKTEQIHGVRFIGDKGYVVTFRQTDPLYTVDVSDPTKPVVAGELKIPGYSAYLHPVGEDLILGVGMDGTEEGQLLGLQLSLFDVSDDAAPKQLHKATIGDDWGWSEALFDHKAFLWWGKTGLAMLPLEWGTYDENIGYSWEQGAFGFRVDKEDGISLIGEVQHPEPVVEECWDEYYGCYYSPMLRRSIVIGEQVFTLSDVGLKASALADLSDAHWVEFPQN